MSEFLENNHWNTFSPSLNKAFEFYFKEIFYLQEKEVSIEAYEVTLKVKTLSKKDTIYTTGSQTNLGNWRPDKVKMKKVSTFERALTLKIKSPAQFKITGVN
ncbi:hypothetical protein ES044_08950 [Polaribacter sp. IC066]|uniref:carbohydrate-binding module family 20 domain-containing protein n=1 Tax=Polaribacter sp. IC066 TaxID=57032 RepID=UPI0011BDE127|nr:carbohydrate-binding module family 20 domain-containing protein [Polaribacter sp. IC066]TXD59784.1 hypothetical protein ES044_08950 [Polaribacter sp. IC066]